MLRSSVIALAAITVGAACQAQSATAGCPASPRTAAAPLTLFEYDRAAELDVRDSLASTDRGVDVHRISFVSPKGGRATGLLHVPHDSLRVSRGRGPAIVRPELSAER